MNINKVAAKDASDWARAEMFFGEGAGTRRKLIIAEIGEKNRSIPGYPEAFSKAYHKQNFADHAIKAAKERQRLDRSNVIGKNLRALGRGDSRGLSTGVMVVVVVGYYAHQTGYDKVALAEVKKYHRKLKAKFAAYNQGA